MNPNKELTLEQQIDLKKRKERASQKIDAILKEERLGLQVYLDYSPNGTTPRLTVVDIKDYNAEPVDTIENNEPNETIKAPEETKSKESAKPKKRK